MSVALGNVQGPFCFLICTFTAVVLKCRVAAVKSRPVLAFNAVIISSLNLAWLDIHELTFRCPVKTRVPLKPVLGGVSGVAYSITTMNKLNETEFASFSCLLRLVMFKDLSAS